jgi:hypothetical protein
LLLGIVAIGVLDLGFTTYVSHEDLFNSSPSLISKAKRLVSSPIEPPQATLPELDQDSMSVAAMPKETHIAERQFRSAPIGQIDRKAQPRKSITAAVVHVNINQPAPACRVVSYPFIGDQYVVQVTDDTGCLTQIASKYRPNILLAQVMTRRSQRSSFKVSALTAFPQSLPFH